MGFHIHTTDDPESGMTMVLELDLGRASVVFENRGTHIHVTVLHETKRNDETETTEMSLTPEEVSAFVKGFQALRTKKNSG